jgi:hypothetical protein
LRGVVEMKRNLELKIFHKLPRLSAALLTAGLTVLPMGVPTVVVTSVVVAPESVEALPRDRARGRQAARYSRRTGRQVSRARRRGYYALPPGAVLRPFGPYRYYFVGSRWYYPYMYGGRTVYIVIDVDDEGNPTPPPPSDSIEIDF